MHVTQRGRLPSSPSLASRFAARVPVDRAQPSGEIPYQGRAESTAYRHMQDRRGRVRSSSQIPGRPELDRTRYHQCCFARSAPHVPRLPIGCNRSGAALDHQLVYVFARAVSDSGQSDAMNRRCERRHRRARASEPPRMRATVERYVAASRAAIAPGSPMALPAMLAPLERQLTIASVNVASFAADLRLALRPNGHSFRLDHLRRGGPSRRESKRLRHRSNRIALTGVVESSVCCFGVTDRSFGLHATIIRLSPCSRRAGSWLHRFTDCGAPGASRSIKRRSPLRRVRPW